MRNRFEALQEKTEKGTPNDEYENFVNAHLAATANFIPTKSRNKYRVPWEMSAAREKYYRKNPTNTNAQKLKKAQNELASIYLKEQTEYIQNQIDKIRDSVEDRQSRKAWQMINKVSRRKSTAKAKLKATNQQERMKLWKQHFEHLQGNPLKVTHDHSLKKNSTQSLEKFKTGKPLGLTRFPQKYGRPDNLTTYCSNTVTQSIIKIRLTDG